MSIKLRYSPLMRKKMQRRLDDALKAVPPRIEDVRGRKVDKAREERAEHVRLATGMNDSYLLGVIKERYGEPSARVLNNMGLEIWVKDIETGEMEKLSFPGRCEIDHSDPSNPKMIGLEDEAAD